MTLIPRSLKRKDEDERRNVSLATEAIYRWMMQHNHAADRDWCESIARFVVLTLAQERRLR